jgi:hypothetical protein
MSSRKLRLGEKEDPKEKITPGRTPEELVKLVKKVGASEVAKTLTEEEIKTIILREPTARKEKKAKEEHFKAIHDLVLEVMRFKQEKVIEVSGVWAKTSDTKSFVVEPLQVALYLLSLEMPRLTMEGWFNDLFTVNLTQARNLIGESALMRECGGRYETKEMTSVSVK